MIEQKEFKLEDFIESLVTIDEINPGQFGHYPFQLVTENDKRELTVAALCLGGDVLSVYKTAKTMIHNGAVRMFLSVDFPANKLINYDYVAVFSFDNNELGCSIIPYDPATGKQLGYLMSGEPVDEMKKQFTHHVLN